MKRAYVVTCKEGECNDYISVHRSMGEAERACKQYSIWHERKIEDFTIYDEHLIEETEEGKS